MQAVENWWESGGTVAYAELGELFFVGRFVSKGKMFNDCGLAFVKSGSIGVFLMYRLHCVVSISRT